MYLYTLFVSLLVSVNASSVSGDASSRFKSSLRMFRTLEKVNATQPVVPNYVRVKSSRFSALPSTVPSIGPKSFTPKPIVASPPSPSTLSTPSFEPVTSSSSIPSSTLSSIPNVPETLEAEKESSPALFETVAPEFISPMPTVSQVDSIVHALKPRNRIAPVVSPIVRVDVPVVEQAHVQSFTIDQAASEVPSIDQAASEVPSIDQTASDALHMDYEAPAAPPMDYEAPAAPPMDLEAPDAPPMDLDASQALAPIATVSSFSTPTISALPKGSLATITADSLQENRLKLRSVKRLERPKDENQSVVGKAMAKRRMHVDNSADENDSATFDPDKLSDDDDDESSKKKQDDQSEANEKNGQNDSVSGEQLNEDDKSLKQSVVLLEPEVDTDEIPEAPSMDDENTKVLSKDTTGQITHRSTGFGAGNGPTLAEQIKSKTTAGLKKSEHSTPPTDRNLPQAGNSGGLLGRLQGQVIQKQTQSQDGSDDDGWDE